MPGPRVGCGLGRGRERAGRGGGGASWSWGGDVCSRVLAGAWLHGHTGSPGGAVSAFHSLGQPVLGLSTPMGTRLWKVDLWEVLLSQDVPTR